jgi:hypothetical protein
MDIQSNVPTQDSDFDAHIALVTTEVINMPNKNEVNSEPDQSNEKKISLVYKIKYLKAKKYYLTNK